MALLRIIFSFLVVAVSVSKCAHFHQKRNFARLGCMGTFDRSKFAKLDAVCEECYELFREPDIHGRCRDNCFNNSNFSKCVKALLLEHEEDELDETVQLLYGKRK